MGIRQTAQPLGVAIGAVGMPELTEIENGFFAALLYPAIACAVAALAALSAWPTRRGRRGRPPSTSNWPTRTGARTCCNASTWFRRC
ncbi:hypothetical protein [Mycobacterium noviomagense]|uniref:hypothetical protein n=1 Tax=Mycobacterium noviomagense TaxID=459858 RepID=UPI002F9656B4